MTITLSASVTLKSSSEHNTEEDAYSVFVAEAEAMGWASAIQPATEKTYLWGMQGALWDAELASKSARGQFSVKPLVAPAGVLQPLFAAVQKTTASFGGSTLTDLRLDMPEFTQDKAHDSRAHATLSRFTNISGSSESVRLTLHSSTRNVEEALKNGLAGWAYAPWVFAPAEEDNAFLVEMPPFSFGTAGATAHLIEDAIRRSGFTDDYSIHMQASDSARGTASAGEK